MTNDRFRFLFNRYVNQTISDVERKEFYLLISKSDSDENLKKLLESLWASVPEENVHESVPVNVFEKIVQVNSEKQDHKNKSTGWIRVAAAVSLIAVACFGVYFYSFVDKEAVSPTASTNITGHQSFIRLPDGSSVVLNTNSTLRYPDSFDGMITREVFLEGEGYFDIQHDPARPFIVRSQNVTTTVLGTSFNVKAFPRDKDVTVTVTRGKVQVSVSDQILGVVTRDHQLTVEKKSVKTDHHVTNSQTAISWMEHDIVFDNVTMEDAMLELRNRFHVNIDLVNTQLRSCRFTATFVNGEDLDQILLVICEFNKATFQRTASNRIEILGSGCE